LAAESILILGATLPFAGRRTNEGLGRFSKSKGFHTFEQFETDDYGVLEKF
jgi:hypothetical protein